MEKSWPEKRLLNIAAIASVFFGRLHPAGQLYVSGTVVLLEALIERPVEPLVVASSMSIYGEGLYREPDGTTTGSSERPLAQLKAKDWELRNGQGQIVSPLPTPETKPHVSPSVYALSKYDQERMRLVVG